MDVEVNISGGILARTTNRAKILMLGNMLPTSDNPVRLAEEIAMLDVISGGRIISGFVRGIGIESWANNTNPVYNRERFEEVPRPDHKNVDTPARSDGKGSITSTGRSIPGCCLYRNPILLSGYPAPAARKRCNGRP